LKVEQHEPSRVTGLCCSLLGYSRQSYYQYQKQQQRDAFEEELIVQEVLVHRRLQKRIGGRKLFVMMNLFLKQHAIGMGRDAFFSLLRSNGLLVRIRKRKAITTDSNHPYRKYPNLIKEFIPIASNQLWVRYYLHCYWRWFRLSEFGYRCFQPKNYWFLPAQNPFGTGHYFGVETSPEE